jgi:hypothetical protein
MAAEFSGLNHAASFCGIGVAHVQRSLISASYGSMPERASILPRKSRLRTSFRKEVCGPH